MQELQARRLAQRPQDARERAEHRGRARVLELRQRALVAELDVQRPGRRDPPQLLRVLVVLLLLLLRLAVAVVLSRVVGNWEESALYITTMRLGRLGP